MMITRQDIIEAKGVKRYQLLKEYKRERDGQRIIDRIKMKKERRKEQNARNPLLTKKNIVIERKKLYLYYQHHALREFFWVTQK